jgi:hypothetical protein
MNPTMLPKKWLLATTILYVIACSPGDPPPSPRPSPPPAPVPSPPGAEEPVLELPIPKPPPPYIPSPVLYLEPDQFPEAPPELRQALTELGCGIPQVLDPPESVQTELYQDNLVSGHFKSTGELHWAVLCSRNKETTLLLFDSLGRLEETLDGPREDDEGSFLWYVDATDREHILEDHASFGGKDTPEPPPIFLEGLEDGLAGKASSIRYWHDCQWIELQGGD